MCYRSRLSIGKNRYTDVLCLDQSRVVMRCVDGDPSSDYINANFVDGYRQKNAYISTQGDNILVSFLLQSITRSHNIAFIQGGPKKVDHF